MGTLRALPLSCFGLLLLGGLAGGGDPQASDRRTWDELRAELEGLPEGHGAAKRTRAYLEHADWRVRHAAARALARATKGEAAIRLLWEEVAARGYLGRAGAALEHADIPRELSSVAAVRSLAAFDRSALVSRARQSPQVARILRRAASQGGAASLRALADLGPLARDEAIFAAALAREEAADWAAAAEALGKLGRTELLAGAFRRGQVEVSSALLDAPGGARSARLLYPEASEEQRSALARELAQRANLDSIEPALLSPDLDPLIEEIARDPRREGLGCTLRAHRGLAAVGSFCATIRAGSPEARVLQMSRLKTVFEVEIEREGAPALRPDLAGQRVVVDRAVAECLQAEAPEVRARALEWLGRRAGAAAIRRGSLDRAPRVRQAACKALHAGRQAKLLSVVARFDPDPAVRETALEQIAALGSWPALQLCLANGRAREAAAKVLHRIDARLIPTPALLWLSRDAKEEVSRAAIRVLAERTDDSAVRSRLARLVQSQDRTTRRLALEALGDDVPVAVLVNLVRDYDGTSPKDEEDFTRVMKQIAKSSDRLPLFLKSGLVGMIRHQFEQGAVTRFAAEALTVLPLDDDLMSLLDLALDLPRARPYACQGIARLDSRAKAFLPKLRHLLLDASVVEVMGKVGEAEDAEDLVGLLLVPGLAPVALQALVELGEPALPHFPTLIEAANRLYPEGFSPTTVLLPLALRARDPAHLRLYCEAFAARANRRNHHAADGWDALRSLGPKARSAQPWLFDVASDPDVYEDDRDWACRVLLSMDPTNREPLADRLLDSLRRCPRVVSARLLAFYSSQPQASAVSILERDIAEIRKSCCYTELSKSTYALGALGPQADAAFARLLANPDPVVRRQAAGGLGSGATSSVRVAYMRAALLDPAGLVNQGAARAVFCAASGGPSGAEACRDLARILGRGLGAADWYLADECADALRALGVHAAPALPSLRAALERTSTRSEAIEVLAGLASTQPAARAALRGVFEARDEEAVTAACGLARAGDDEARAFLRQALVRSTKDEAYVRKKLVLALGGEDLAAELRRLRDLVDPAAPWESFGEWSTLVEYGGEPAVRFACSPADWPEPYRSQGLAALAEASR